LHADVIVTFVEFVFVATFDSMLLYSGSVCVIFLKVLKFFFFTDCPDFIEEEEDSA